MSALTTNPTTSPRLGRGPVIAMGVLAGVLVVGAVAIPRLTSTTADTSSTPVVAPTGLGGGAPSPREISATQRAERLSVGIGIRAMDPRAWVAVAGTSTAVSLGLPQSADAAERWLSGGTTVTSSVTQAPTTPDVAERRALGVQPSPTDSGTEPQSPRGMQRPRD